MTGDLFVLSAPSGAGKTTVWDKVEQTIPDVAYSVSHTTRPPRPSEIDGQDYHFVSREKFQKMIDEGQFLEYAIVFDNLYGTAKGPVLNRLEKGRDVYLDIDVKGADQVKEAYPRAVTIMLLPPSMAELEMRLRKRGTETEQQIKLRLDTAAKEIKAGPKYDYLVVNDDVEKAARTVTGIIFARRARRERVWPTIEKQL